MIQRNLLVLLVPSLIGMAACTVPAVGVSPEATPSVTVPAGMSPTPIIWFPPTETSTVAPAPTLRPTAERKPGVGELMVEDPMTSATFWNAAAEGGAAATVSERGLSLSARPGGPPVVSLQRSAVFDDMYMEITARTNLCRGKDAYGVVFRAPNNVAHYRFSAVCDGTAAAERVSLGTPHVLQPPTATSDVPIGAPGEVRLGVWASGSELRFFLNDRYQFSVIDKNYASGGLGVFVEARSDSPVVVTFSDLRVYRLLEPELSATPTP
jgi:hypothetical protein